MKKDYEHVAMLLDRSGSMASIKNDVIGGFNEFIEKQKQVPGEMSVSLFTFASHRDRETVFDFVKLDDIKPLTENNYVPGGSTALIDAFAVAVIDTGKKLADMPEHERPDKVLFVCISDGEENDSREHTLSQLRDMIEKQKNLFKWEFLFIGANQDVFHEAGKLGISKSKAFVASSAGTRGMYADLDATNTKYRTSGSSGKLD